MISVVLYGRNDSYGYNLHKRAALSLNCIAEILTHADDEILFVDYNTPDDFPTFPEAIQDTLTPRVRKLLRILRVRPDLHQRFKDRSHLVALEPVARNVAIRRSNPANRWVLSTNTDMIFVPRHPRSLSEIAAELPSDGFYHLPRFEIPESLWESLDRMDPSGTIARIDEWGKSFHLNEVVHANDPWVKFDGPGDFQLMLRSDLFRISGFHEEMLLGWHVDSNIARRLYLLHGQTRDLLDQLFGYHCDHTRQVTPAHRAGSVQNDIVKFNDEVRRPELPEQADSWGLAGERIEELTVNSTSSLYVNGLSSVITRGMSEPSHVTYGTRTYDKVDYQVPHVLPFLTDILASYSRDTRIGWFGARRELLTAFAEAIAHMGFAEPIMIAQGASWLGEDLPHTCMWTNAMQAAAQADILVFDCGLLPADDRAEPDQPHPSTLFLANWFRRAVRAEQVRFRDPDALPRRFIAVNAIHNRFESLVGAHITAARSPMASRIRQGFVVPRPEEAEIQDIFPLFAIGGAGRRESDCILSVPNKAGFIVYGPYLSLDAGQYRLTLTFAERATGKATASWASGSVALEIFADPYLLGTCPIRNAVVSGGQVSMAFTISERLLELLPWLRVEFRLRTNGTVPVSLTAATLQQAMTFDRDVADYDLLPLLIPGRAAKRTGLLRRARPAMRGGTRISSASEAIRAIPGRCGHVVYGPYAALPPGRYEARFALDIKAGSAAVPCSRFPIAVEIVDHEKNHFFAHRYVSPTESSQIVLPFEIGPDNESLHGVEFRVWSSGELDFAVLGVTVQRLRSSRAIPADFQVQPLESA